MSARFDSVINTIRKGGNLVPAFREGYSFAVQQLLEHRNLNPLAAFAGAVVAAPARPKGATMGKLRDRILIIAGEAVTLKTERSGAVTVSMVKGANLPGFKPDLVEGDWWAEDSEKEDKTPKTDAQRLMEALERFTKKHDAAELALVLAQFEKVQTLKASLEQAMRG